MTNGTSRRRRVVQGHVVVNSPPTSPTTVEPINDATAALRLLHSQPRQHHQHHQQPKQQQRHSLGGWNFSSLFYPLLSKKLNHNGVLLRRDVRLVLVLVTVLVAWIGSSIWYLFWLESALPPPNWEEQQYQDGYMHYSTATTNAPPVFLQIPFSRDSFALPRKKYKSRFPDLGGIKYHTWRKLARKRKIKVTGSIDQNNNHQNEKAQKHGKIVNNEDQKKEAYQGKMNEHEEKHLDEEGSEDEEEDTENEDGEEDKNEGEDTRKEEDNEDEDKTDEKGEDKKDGEGDEEGEDDDEEEEEDEEEETSFGHQILDWDHALYEEEREALLVEMDRDLGDWLDKFDHDEEVDQPQVCQRNNWRSNIFPNCNTFHELIRDDGRDKYLG